LDDAAACARGGLQYRRQAAAAAPAKAKPAMALVSHAFGLDGAA
tara:strand:+ start:998 stop:1129 length:132 start_codon:yes stop_codon:yes gene_type:complete